MMITFFNRKELLITMDMKRQDDVREILSVNGIDYIVKVINRQSDNSRARVGSLGLNPKFTYEYKIYVHKNDYDNALRLIR